MIRIVAIVIIVIVDDEDEEEGDDNDDDLIVMLLLVRRLTFLPVTTVSTSSVPVVGHVGVEGNAVIWSITEERDRYSPKHKTLFFPLNCAQVGAER